MKELLRDAALAALLLVLLAVGLWASCVLVGAVFYLVGVPG